MYGKIKEFLAQELEHYRSFGIYKDERVIQSPQGRRFASEGANC